MAGTTLTTAAAILKRVYPGLIEDALSEEAVMFRKAKKKKKPIKFGEKLVRSIRVSRSQGIGARTETGTLPSAGNQGYAAPSVSVKRNYHRGSITGGALRDTKGSDAAFAEALSADMKYNTTDFVADLDRQLWHGTGKLALINMAANITPGDVTMYLDTPGTKFLGAGMKIDVYSSATQQGNSLTISSVVDSTTVVLETGAALTMSNNAAVYREDNFDGTTVNELSGLQTIVDNGTVAGTYFGLSRTTYPSLKSTVINPVSGTTVTDSYMQQAIDGARSQAGGKIDLILTSYAARRRYASTLLSEKRYPSPYSQSLKGGFKQSSNVDDNTGAGIAYDDVEVIAGRNAPETDIFFLDTSSFTFFIQSDTEWIEDGNGSILHSQLASGSKDAYDYAMYFEGELYCENPGKNSKIINADT